MVLGYFSALSFEYIEPQEASISSTLGESVSAYQNRTLIYNSLQKFLSSVESLSRVTLESSMGVAASL